MLTALWDHVLQIAASACLVAPHAVMPMPMHALCSFGLPHLYTSPSSLCQNIMMSRLRPTPGTQCLLQIQGGLGLELSKQVLVGEVIALEAGDIDGEGSSDVYWLFKVQKLPYDLPAQVTDVWKQSHDRGARVMEGLYYTEITSLSAKKLNRPRLFVLDSDNVAFISVASVVRRDIVILPKGRLEKGQFSMTREQHDSIIEGCDGFGEESDVE